MGIVQGSSIDRRFFHSIGASKLDRTICSTPGKIGMQMTVGANVGADPEGIPESDLVLLWGTNTLTSNPHLWPFVLEAKARGAPIIVIDPIRTRTAAQSDEWIGLRPGTDAALALAMMHVVLERGLQDDDYIARYTTGIDALRERAREYTPERASRITGVAPEVIVSLGERYGRAKAAFIRVNYGLQRHGGGGMAVRTIACLPALTGHWRRAGGGVQLSSSAKLQVQHRACRATRPLAAGAHDQHDPPRRGAHDEGRGSRRAAGARAGRLQLEPRRRSARPQRRARRHARATICSPSCSSIFRPTPPTTRTSFFPRRRSSSTGTCTFRTATTTSR